MPTSPPDRSRPRTLPDRRRGRRLASAAGALIVAAGVIAVGASPAAGAVKKKSRTAVQLTAADVDFSGEATWLVHGKLRSGAEACTKRRTVKLTKGGRLVARARSAGDGSVALRFPIAGNQGTASYAATATKRKVGPRKKRRLCRAGSAPLSFASTAMAVTIQFSDAADEFSGFAEPEHCVLGNGWGLFFGGLSNPIGFGTFNQQPTGAWSYGYGSQPPPGTYIVGTGFQSNWSRNAGGGLTVTICRIATAEVTV